MKEATIYPTEDFISKHAAATYWWSFENTQDFISFRVHYLLWNETNAFQKGSYAVS